jgi:uncharacterized protein (TIGR02466 family)
MIIQDLFIDFCGTEDLNSSFDFSLIQEEVLRYKSDIDASGKKTKLSNIGGYQSKDLLFPEIIENYSNLKELFDYSIMRTKDLLQHEKVSIGNAWININKAKDYNAMHPHPMSIISGIIYIYVPKNMEGGNLKFYRERSFTDYRIDEYLKKEKYGWPSAVITPKTGLLVLFPANLMHSVEPHISNEDRISIAINFTCQ